MTKTDYNWNSTRVSRIPSPQEVKLKFDTQHQLYLAALQVQKHMETQVAHLPKMETQYADFDFGPVKLYRVWVSNMDWSNELGIYELNLQFYCEFKEETLVPEAEEASVDDLLSMAKDLH